MKSLFLTQCVALSLSAGIIGLGTVLSNPAPSEAQVMINVTGGSVSGELGVLSIENPTGTLITPYGVYTGPFSATNLMSADFGTTNLYSFFGPSSNDFAGNAYVNGTSTPFAGRLDLTVDLDWPGTLGNVSRNITGGTITLNTPNTLTGFSFEPPVTSTTGSSTTGSSTTGSSTTGSSTTGSSSTGSSTTGSSTTGSSTTGSSTTGSSTTGSSTAGSSTTGSSTTGSSTTSPSIADIPELTATNFTTPEPLTEPGGVGQAALRSQGQQAQQFRPNGVHTRIIPTWTPGLYQ